VHPVDVELSGLDLAFLSVRLQELAKSCRKRTVASCHPTTGAYFS